MAVNKPRIQERMYFFPPPTQNDNLTFMRFRLHLAYLAAACHNIFKEIFAPAAEPERKDSFRLFPAMMIFRHATELLLKAIIKDVLKNDPPTNTHKVSDIFEEHLMGKIKWQSGTEELFVRSALRELQDVDAGDAFRFGFDRKGQPHFQDEPLTVDARKLFDVCEKLWEALCRVHGPVSYSDADSGNVAVERTEAVP